MNQHPPQTHIVKAFSDELDQLHDEISRMGGMAETQVADAVRAVARRDTALAAEVVAREDQVNEMQVEIEKQVIRLFALRQPMAADLRTNIAALKIASDLERIGDLAKNIARRTEVLNAAEPIQLTRSVERMGQLVSAQLNEVLNAYAARDLEPAKRVWRNDDEVDAHYDSLFRELVTYMMEDPRMIGASAHLLFVAKNLERIGDHATNIAEVIHYLVTGDHLVMDNAAPAEGAPDPQGA